MSSSFTCQWAVFRAERLQGRRTGGLFDLRKWGIVEFLYATYVLGAIFVVGQIYEYALLTSEHVGLASDSYGSAFYLTTGFHGLHVTGGLIAFILLIGAHLRREALHPQGGDERHRRLVLLALRRRGVDRPLPRHLRAQMIHALKPKGTKPRMPKQPIDRKRGRRSPLATVALIAIGLMSTGGAYALFTTSATAETGAHQAALVEDGGKLFAANCATCHGMNLQGTAEGPSLIGVGAAAVEFQVATGRMPLAATGPQAEEKPPQFTAEQIEALYTFVASKGAGPGIPDEEYLAGEGDVAAGGELFRVNCAMCHNVAGAGGALTEGKYAPSLEGVSAQHVYEAMVTGPQNMPVFNDMTITPEQKANIIAYLKYLDETPAAGGLTLGGLGPVSEGLFIWIFGLGAIVAITIWLTAKSN